MGLNLSEQAKIAYLQEKVKLAKRSQLISDVGAFFGVIVAVFGFWDGILILEILGITLFIIGFAGGTFYLKQYRNLMEDFRQMATASIVCPECGQKVPQENYAYCPFCVAPLKSWSMQAKH